MEAVNFFILLLIENIESVCVCVCVYKQPPFQIFTRQKFNMVSGGGAIAMVWVWFRFTYNVCYNNTSCSILQKREKKEEGIRINSTGIVFVE